MALALFLAAAPLCLAVFNTADGVVTVPDALPSESDGSVVLHLCFADNGQYTYATGQCPPVDKTARWILEAFDGVEVRSNTYTKRQNVETPVLVKGSVAGGGKYGFALYDRKTPSGLRAAFYDVTIRNLESGDRYGGGIATVTKGIELFLYNVLLEPYWPDWVSYQVTNYDGLVLDGAAGAFGKNVTIRHWNADSAIDNKASVSQFVNLRVEGGGNRAVRYWTDGPHYLVDSDIENTRGGSMLWFRKCASVTLYVYQTTFNGNPTVPSSKVSCDTGSNPNIVYLASDPRTTGEMHEMF
ncbi:hypothetical protein DIPPA_33164 [Diplonema papillatum]|nr:hypothetical protein DIPPA_33164 [Diplonema papillatum]